MADTKKRIWGMHTYDDALYLKHKTLGIGWNEMGDMNSIEPTH